MKNYIAFIVILISQLNFSLGNDSIPNQKSIYLKFNTTGLFHPIHYVSASVEIQFNSKLAYETELGIINSITGIPFANVQHSKTNQLFPQRVGIRTVNTFKVYFTRKKKEKKPRKAYFAPEFQFSYHLLKDDSYLYSNNNTTGYGYSYSKLFPTKSTFFQLGAYIKFGWQKFIGKNKKAIVDTYFGFGYYGIKQYYHENPAIPAEFNQQELDRSFNKIERALNNSGSFMSSYFMLNFGVKFGKKLK